MDKVMPKVMPNSTDKEPAALIMTDPDSRALSVSERRIHFEFARVR
jgi:hypothetical protein